MKLNIIHSMSMMNTADKTAEEQTQDNEQEKKKEKEEEEEETSVGMVVVRGPASEHATACASKELAKAGLSRVVVVEVAFAAMLVGAAQVGKEEAGGKREATTGSR